MRFRKFINLILFILLAPIIGSSEAAKSINDDVFKRIYTEDIQFGIVRGKGIEYELYKAAKHYENSGVKPEIEFEYLFTHLSNWLESRRKLLTEILIVILTCVILLTGIVPLLSCYTPASASIVLPIATLFLIPIIHEFQIELIKYKYYNAIIIGLIASIITHLITRNVILDLIMFGIGFSIIYIPSFISFIKNYLGLKIRVMESFHELMWSPNPKELKPYTIVEQELKTLFDTVKSLGIPALIARANRLIDTLMTHLIDQQRIQLIYALFIPIGYFCALFVLSIIKPSLIYTPTPIYWINIENIKYALIISGISTAILTGKTIHSIGLGVSLIPIFLIPLLFIL